MSPVLALTLVIGLIAANGLFVASEFALVAARRGVIEERAEAGEKRARATLGQMKNLSFVLSGAQFGITVTSLAVGLLAEDSIAELLRPALDATGLPMATARAVSIALAFAISTIVQMVFGELAPKAIAIARPEQVALRIGRLMRAYEVVFGPIIRLFDNAAAGLTRLFGVEPQEELVGGHSSDEIARIIEASSEGGSLSGERAEMLKRAVELGDRRVQEVLVPRPDVAWLQRDEPASALLAAAKRTGFSRFPVYGESEDDVVGTVHIKDLLAARRDASGISTVGDLATPPLVVPESHTLRRTLTALRRAHRTFAVVIDEYGGTAGIVTVEDIVEELVGDIEDEYDRDQLLIRRIGTGRYRVRGSVRADRISDLLDVPLPEGEYETLAGFVIAGLGRIPEVGEELIHGDWTFTVTRRDGMRVADLDVRRRQREELPAELTGPPTGGDA